MKKFAYSFVAVLALGAAYVAGSWHQQTATVEAAAPVAQNATTYTCSMHPEYHSDKPGTCPACGMALIEVKKPKPAVAETMAGESMSTDAPTAMPIDINADTQQLIGVRVATVERSSGSSNLRLFGRVAPQETRTYQLAVGLDGWMRDLSGATTGSLVAKDELLATFSSADLRQPVQALLVTLDALDREATTGNDVALSKSMAHAGVEGAIDRLLSLGMSRVQIEEIRRTRVLPADMKITAPSEGFLLRRSASVGQHIEKGAQIFEIADLRRVWIWADVPAADADLLRPGMEADVMIPGRPTPLRAKVSADVRPQFDAASQAIRVRLDADNPGYAFRPGMLVDVDVHSTFTAATVVPNEAIVPLGRRSTVFIERRAGHFEPRQVTTGRRFGDRTEILDGLTAGERIVASGTFLLDSETKLRAR